MKSRIDRSQIIKGTNGARLAVGLIMFQQFVSSSRKLLVELKYKSTSSVSTLLTLVGIGYFEFFLNPMGSNTFPNYKLTGQFLLEIYENLERLT